MTKLGEGVLERRCTDLIVTRDVELAEERVQSLLCRVLLNWESSRNEFVVVNHTCSVQINFRQYVLKFAVSQVRVESFDSRAQLFNFDRTASISVNLVELPPEIHEFARVDHLDQNVEAFAAQSVPTMEVL